MSTVSLRDAKAGLSAFVDEAIKGHFVTITRHGKPVAALVPLEAAEIAQRALRPGRPSFASYLKTFPGGEFERNQSPARDVEF
ncbi:MAG: prevent-host-death family protein [Devosia sp.]|nr:prevent-host-death family protein [Devosia sp.]